ncbi:hypothetical protein TWF281_003656 [Arthrobotrys megalospora]
MSPILLLKTRSTPTDPYATLLSSNGYDPIFVPVLQHHPINADIVRSYILDGSIVSAGENEAINSDDKDKNKFGALIITSQRAVEALGVLIEELKESHKEIISTLLSTTTIYVVGPATRNSLIALGFTSSNVVGEDSGNGAVLADFIVENYSSKGDLLFLTGETHSTTIPTRVPDKLRELKGLEVNVEEVVVYKTGVMEGFETDLRECLKRLDQEGSQEDGPRWIIFFSPTGTDAALRILEEREKEEGGKGPRYKCCSIGPTTKDYMHQKFGRRADAMAKAPSPEGVLEAVRSPGRVAVELVT